MNWRQYQPLLSQLKFKIPSTSTSKVWRTGSWTDFQESHKEHPLQTLFPFPNCHQSVGHWWRWNGRQLVDPVIAAEGQALVKDSTLDSGSPECWLVEMSSTWGRSAILGILREIRHLCDIDKNADDCLMAALPHKIQKQQCSSPKSFFIMILDEQFRKGVSGNPILDGSCRVQDLLLSGAFHRLGSRAGSSSG